MESGAIRTQNNAMRCKACSTHINSMHYLSWEMLVFCKDICLKNYQNCLGVTCRKCERDIPSDSIGKYYKTVNNYYYSFCSKSCFESYVYPGVYCGYCHKTKQPDSNDKWLNVVIKMELKNAEYTINVCSEKCGKCLSNIAKNDYIIIPEGAICTVCKCHDPLKIIAHHEDQIHYICDERCLRAFCYVKYGNQAERCHMCKQYFSKKTLEERAFCSEKGVIKFCSYGCLNIYRLLQNDNIVCQTCKLESSNFCAVKMFTPKKFIFCSLKCMGAFSEVGTINSNMQIEKNIMTIRSPIKTRSHTIYRSLQSITHLLRGSTSLRNVATLTKSLTASKSTSTILSVSEKLVQTEPEQPTLLCVPVPIYVPTPMAMYGIPVAVPVPFPIPIPCPILIPTTKNTSKEVLRHLEIIRDKMPDDPYQAELLQIADTLADQVNISDNEASGVADRKENMNITNQVVEDIVDEQLSYSPDEKRIKSKDIKQEDKAQSAESCRLLDRVEEKRLVYNLGINAWKQWITNKKFPMNMKVKTEILDMTSDELNHYLCLFVEELRKPNGDEYAPDTLYYLCLSIQYYLDNNGRTENIFIDPRFEAFTDVLDKLAKKFCALYFDESNFIVTRVEEEHLWETKQLGCHSPQILLNTLIYFNTKYFYRSTVEEHHQLTFHHIIRFHKKKSERNSTMLRFFPKYYSDRDARRYVQEENIEDPLRCPVKLYEYYLAKCPETVKNDNISCMYLVPEKYCISESPVWYSTTSLPKRSLEKVVNRFKMVKEVNVALLSNH